MATKSDKILAQFVIVLVIPTTINLVTSWLTDEWRWVGFFVAAVLAISILLTMPDGLLSRRRYGTQRIGRWAAMVALIAYVGVTGWIAITGGSWWVALLAGSCLWVSCTLLVWSAIRRLRRRLDAALGLAVLLAGTAFILAGINAFHSDRSVQSVPLFLIGVGVMMAALGILTWRLAHVGWAPLMLGLADLIWAVGAFGEWEFLQGTARAFRAACFIWLGLALLKWTFAHLASALLLLATGFIFEGVDSIYYDALLEGAGFVLLGLSALAFYAARRARLRMRDSLVDVANLLSCAALIVWGVIEFNDGALLLGIGFTLWGGVSLILTASSFGKGSDADWLKVRRYFLGDSDGRPNG